MAELLSAGLFATALLLGVKHSFDADHLVAVGNFLRNSDSLKNAFWMSASWSLGHVATASVITVLLLVFRESVLNAFLSNFELVVGIMLVGIGLWSLRDAFYAHAHRHAHGGKGNSHAHLHIHKKGGPGVHFHKHMLGIGIAHGLASNDELLVLLTLELGLASLGQMLLGVAVFSLGVVLGMLLFAAFFTIPLIKAHSVKLYRGVTLGMGAASVIYGASMVFPFI